MTVPPPMPPPAGGMPGGAPYGPLKVRYNPVLGAIAIAIGVINLILAVTGARDYPIGWFVGVVFTVLGILYCVGTALVVDQQSARVKNPLQMTLKTVPLHGIGDLMFEGKKLYRAGDHSKIVNLGWGSVRGEDLRQLQAAIGRARSAAPPR